MLTIAITFLQWILPNGFTAAWRYWRHTRPARKLVDPFGRKTIMFVYSTVVMTEYLARDGRNVVIEVDRGVHGEGVVSSYGDVLGYFHIADLLKLAGIRERDIAGKRCDELMDGDWEGNLILLGSPVSNSRSRVALQGIGYRFDDKVESIIKETAPQQHWVGNQDYDYCIVSRKVNKELSCSYLILAGLGPAGTQAGCHYLARRYRELARKYGDGAFIVILQVDRHVGYTAWTEVHSQSDAKSTFT